MNGWTAYCDETNDMKIRVLKGPMGHMGEPGRTEDGDGSQGAFLEVGGETETNFLGRAKC